MVWVTDRPHSPRSKTCDVPLSSRPAPPAGARYCFDSLSDVLFPETAEVTDMAEHDKDKPDKFTIIVNAKKKTVTTEELTFEQVVTLAFDPVPSGSFFTVTY